MTTLRVTKYDAAGNTFLVCRVKQRTLDKRRWGRLARTACDPRVGLCADGLLTIRPSRRADFRLDVFNADGSWAERSGNGLRCAVADALEQRPRRTGWMVDCGPELVVARAARLRGQLVVNAAVGEPEGAMAPLEFRHGGRPLKIHRVRIGNPHAVICLPRVPKDWEALAQAIATDRRFRGGVNVEVVVVRSRRALEARVWERGVGPTASSGTGAAAALVALARLGKVSESATVKFGAEAVTVRWSGEGSAVEVAGPVRRVCAGELVV